jgi:hypothetical protein
MEEKWNVQRKGYLKIHVAVNVKTKEILALEVTNEKVHDGRMLTILRRFNQSLPMELMIQIETLDILRRMRSPPGIKVRKNSVISIINNRLRNREVRLQTKDLLKWKMKRKYGHRWIAETAFSTIKRIFGEYVSATRFQNMVNEMMIKISLYNLFRRI